MSLPFFWSVPAPPSATAPPGPPHKVSTDAPGDAPFVVERYRVFERGGRGGYFTPAARVLVTPALRTSGLLASLSDGEVRTLLAMLTFATANGRIQPGTPELAEALGVPEKEARERLRRLAATTWHGSPLAREIASETGRVSGVLSPAAVQARDAPETPLPGPQPVPSRKAEVIAYSRAAYGTPRAEAERAVAAQLRRGGDASNEAEDDGTPAGEARRRLRAYGISAHEAERLISSYPLERIERQIGWMGMRQARDPARFLAAAIRGDYAPPDYVRRRKEQEVTEPMEERDVERQGITDEEGVGVAEANADDAG